MLCIVQSRLIIYDIKLYVDSDLVQLQVFRLYTSHLFSVAGVFSARVNCVWFSVLLLCCDYFCIAVCVITVTNV